MAVSAAMVGFAFDPVPVRDVAALGVAAASGVALVVSIVTRRAGVRGAHELASARSARVAAMTGIERDAPARDDAATEFPPWLDLIAPVLGAVGLVAAAFA